MNEACPISQFQINEKAARLTGFLVFAIVAAIIFLPYKWIIALLLIDFFMRAFVNPSYSPLLNISMLILQALKVTPLMTNAGPKMFAAKMGFFFCACIGISVLLKANLLTNIFCGMIMACALMQSLLGFCVGCKIYSLLRLDSRIGQAATVLPGEDAA